MGKNSKTPQKVTTIPQAEIIKSISTEWEKHLKNDDNTHKLFWQIDLFTLSYVLENNLERLKNENYKLNEDLKKIVRELHYSLRNKTNKKLIDNYSPNLISNLRKLYGFDSKKNLEFKTNAQKYKSPLTKERIFSRLSKYNKTIRSVLDASKMVGYITGGFLEQGEYPIVTQYIIKSLLLDYKQTRGTLQKQLEKNLVNSLFASEEIVLKRELNSISKEIQSKAIKFIEEAFSEIKNDNQTNFEDFISQISSGQSTQQKDYAYNVYGFVFNELFKFKNIEDAKKAFIPRIFELFIRILLYSHIGKEYHKHDSLEEKSNLNLSYIDLLDTVYRAIYPKITFLQDYFQTIDPKDLPSSIKTNFKEPITQEFLANRTVHSKLKNDLWYKIVIAFSKELSSSSDLKKFNLKSSEALKVLYETRETEPKRFHDFDSLLALLNSINEDFTTLLTGLKNGQLNVKLKNFKNINLIDNVVISLKSGYYDSFFDNINFDAIKDTVFKKVLKTSLEQLIPQLGEYSVVTSVSHIDPEGKIKKIADNTYLYDSRKWDAGENNQLDFFNPTNFRGPHKEYADIRYASPFYFMASHTGWGQSINSKGKMTRHSARLLIVETAYGIDHAIYKSRVKAKKLKELLIVPWTIYTNSRQSANIKISDQYFVVNNDFTEYNFKDLNKSEVFEEDKMTMSSESYKNFDSLYLPLFSSTILVDQNILESIRYWQESLWDKDPEGKFLSLIKAISALLGKDPTSVGIGNKRYLDILGSTVNSDYWKKYLYNDITNFYKKIDSNPKLRKAYKKIVGRSTYYLDLLKNIEKIRNDANFSEIKQEINEFVGKYNAGLLEGNTKYHQSMEEIDLIIFKMKRHSIVHHDNTNAFDGFDIGYYNWKLANKYIELLIDLLNSRSNRSTTYEHIISNLNV